MTPSEQADASAVVRSVERVITSHRQREGAGFIVRRPFPAPGLEQLDPFLLLDTRTPILYLDFQLAHGALLEQPVPAAFQVFAYVYGGQVQAGLTAAPLQDGQSRATGALVGGLGLVGPRYGRGVERCPSAPRCRWGSRPG